MGQIYASRPIATRPGSGDVFLSEDEIADLHYLDRLRIVQNLPLAGLLSLFMVSEAEGDVCATCLHNPKPGYLTIYVAKNQNTLAGEEHMMKLLGLYQGDILCRWSGFSAFKEAALNTILPFCLKKVKKRLKALAAVMEAIEDLATELEDMDLEEFQPWDSSIFENPTAMVKAITGEGSRERTGDIAVIDAARQLRLPVANVFSIQLQKISRDLQSGVDVSSFSKLSNICDKLHASVLFKVVLKMSKLQGSVKEKLSVDLGKVGAYSHGIEILYRALIEPAKKEKVPIKLRCHILSSPPRRTIKLEEDWFQFLQQLSMSWVGGGQYLPLGKEELLAEWGKNSGEHVQIQHYPKQRIRNS